MKQEEIMKQKEIMKRMAEEADEKIKKLLSERGKEYGRAWLESGLFYTRVSTELQTLIASGFLHNHVLIVSKLMRILRTPTTVDHWKDIAGYAQLVVDYLEGDDYVPDN